jgi:starvation-inducible DNA-binding protein
MNSIGINQEKAAKLAEELSQLLANYQLFYANVRGFHWNIRGAKFFELHLKFEELYNDLNLKVDEIAERILTLGFSPEYRYSVYKTISEIQEVEHTNDGEQNMANILKGLQLLLGKQRHIMNMAQEANDEGTASQMSDYVREQEKLVWMYSAFLNK